MAAKKIRVNVTVPEGFAPGETFVIEVEVPHGRGQRITKPIDDMTKEELKKEIINAGSVLYKAQKRGADEDIINKNQARLDAAKALMAEKFPAVAQPRTRKMGGTQILMAEGRILTQDEIDHPEKYMSYDDGGVYSVENPLDAPVDEDVASEI